MGEHLLLITGTPGTGKRAVGNYLVERCAFQHIDLDSRETREGFLASGKDTLRAELTARTQPGQDVVVTWSRSNGQLPYVRALQSLGFEWIWFDGDRGAASPVFRSRFAARAAGSLAPRFVDTFAADGRFRSLEAVIAELLEPQPSLQPRRARTLVRRARRPVVGLRAATAGVLALAAAAAAAAGGYLLTAGGSARPAAHVALTPKPAHARAAAALPRRGVLVTGRSLAGVHLGDSAAKVRKLWGHKFVVCDGCKPTTWFYLYSSENPLGAGVKFRNGRVTAVFTLGSPRGWRNDRGLHVGELLDPFNDPSNTSKWVTCAGYGAKSTKTGDAISSVLTLGESVYGFALTRPSDPVCQ